MGCDNLLITYLEEQLEHGSQQEKFTAANELAEVYKRFLSLDKYRNNPKLLERATNLLNKNAQAATTSLKVQLLRARYLAAEQLLENYRLRYATKEEASEAVGQLKDINKDLKIIHTKLMSRVKRSSTRTEVYDLVGMATSLLAWSNYYIAWFDNSDTEAAEIAQNYFAMMIQAESPTFQQVSLDLKTKEYGARAILGIALCKAIILDSTVTEPWFEELRKAETFESIRLQIPMWEYFQDLDTHYWSGVLEKLTSINADTLMYARLAAVHSLENIHVPIASDVAQRSLAMLTDLGQLAMVSEIVEQYGFESLPADGFISNYLRGDIAFRELTDGTNTNEPTTDPLVRSQFQGVAHLFHDATASQDASEFPTFLNDCYFMLGLSLFQASQFEQASIAFQTVSSRQNDEDSLWMAIVCLDHIPKLDTTLQAIKNGLISSYRSEWPNSNRASQLLVRDAAATRSSFELVSDLLSVSKSDPHYADSQKQAAIHLYNLWRDVQEAQILAIGNKYLNVALQLLFEKIELIESGVITESEPAIVLALRILEISLHQKINRNVAAQHALEAIKIIKSKGDYDSNLFNKEIAYRTILFTLSNNELIEAQEATFKLIELYPHDVWSLHAAKSISRYWDDNQIEVDNSSEFIIGSRIIAGVHDDELVDESMLPISFSTSSAGFHIAVISEEPNSSEGIEALRIARLLQKTYPKTYRILQLVASLEQQVGNIEIALQHWRTIAKGNTQGGDKWLDARLHIVQILSETDPVQALQVLHQHHLLYPNYGNNPYGTKLKELHVLLKDGEDGS